MVGRSISTKQANMNTDSISDTTDEQDSEVVEAWQKVPTEIWRKIFESLKGSPKAVLNARGVCPYWRDIIDEHIKFEVVLNDGSPYWKKMEHVRVKYCCVHRFKNKIPRHFRLFKDLHILTKLNLYGGISQQNFVWLVARSPNLEYFKLRGCVLCEESIFTGTNPQEQLIMTNFWNRLKTLEFTNGYFEEKFLSIWITNFKILLSIRMPNLKSFSFNIQFCNTLPWFVRFLLLNPSITNVDFGLQNTFSMPRALGLPERINMMDLKKIQLQSIKVKVMDLFDYSKSMIVSIIRAQKSLVYLQVNESPSWCMRTHLLYFDELRDMIRLNYSTLSTINFYCLQVTSHLDAKMFEKFTGLKSLKILRQHICHCNGAYQISNLFCLPKTLEKLSIEGLKFVESDLQRVLQPSKLENLRSLTLVGTEMYNLNTQLVESLIQTRKWKCFQVGPVAIEEFQLVCEGKERYVRLGNGMKLQASRPKWLGRNAAILTLVGQTGDLNV